MPSPHVDEEKGKKAMIYKARKDRRKGDRKRNRENRKRKIISLGYVRRGFTVTYHARILDLFYTKTQYFGPRSDQLSFPHSINSLFGLRGPGSIPVLDSSQIGSLHYLFQKIQEKKKQYSQQPLLQLPVFYFFWLYISHQFECSIVLISKSLQKQELFN